MSECPKCEREMRGYKCDCGYKLPFNRPENQAAEKSSNCIAFGCPCRGTISDGIGVDSKFTCRHHHGKDASDWQDITRKLRLLPMGCDSHGCPEKPITVGNRGQMLCKAHWAKEGPKPMAVAA